MCIHRRARGATDRPLYRMQHISMCQEWGKKQREHPPPSSFGPSGFSLLNKLRERERSTALRAVNGEGDFRRIKTTMRKGGGVDESPLPLPWVFLDLLSLSFLKSGASYSSFFSPRVWTHVRRCVRRYCRRRVLTKYLIFKAKKLENDILPRSSIFCTCRNIGGEGLF